MGNCCGCGAAEEKDDKDATPDVAELDEHLAKSDEPAEDAEAHPGVDAVVEKTEDEVEGEVISKHGSILGRESFQDKIAKLNPNQLLVIGFMKDDCGKCDQVSEFYGGLAKKYPDVTFLDANVKQNPDAVKELNLTSVPTFCAFKNHREIGRYDGTNPDAIEGLVTAFKDDDDAKSEENEKEEDAREPTPDASP